MELSSFLIDGALLANRVSPQLLSCTPHIYLSMVPFGRYNSRVCAHFAKYITSPAQVHQRQRSSICLKELGRERDVFPGPPVKYAVSSDGRCAAVAFTIRLVEVWDIEEGKARGTYCQGVPWNYIFTAAAFSPDLKYVAASCDLRVLGVWDTQSGSVIVGPLHDLHSVNTLSLAVSPDGSKLALGTIHGAVVIRDAGNGAVISAPSVKHLSAVKYVTFSPDGHLLASGSYDKTVRIWNVENGDLLLPPLEGHTSTVVCADYAADGRHIVSCSDDGMVRIWDVGTGRTISVFHDLGYIMSVAYSPCGSRIVSGNVNGSVTIWDTEGVKIATGHHNAVDEWVDAVFAPSNGKSIITGGYYGTVRIWDALGRAVGQEREYTHHRSILSVTYSRDGRRIASASADKSVHVWDAEEGASIAGPFLGHQDDVSCVAFLPGWGNRRLVSSSLDKTIRLWNAEASELEDAELSCFQELHVDRVTCMALSTDGTKSASGSTDGMISVWNPTSGKRLISFSGAHSISIQAVAFSPDNKQLAAGTSDGMVRTWDVETWKPTSETTRGHQGGVLSVCFSPDSSRVVSGSEDCTIIVWDSKDLRAIFKPLEGHHGHVTSVVFSVDNKHLFSGSTDGFVRAWDVGTGESVLTFAAHDKPIRCLALSPNGERLASGSDDTRIKVWDVSDLLQTSNDNLGIRYRKDDDNPPGWVLGSDGWLFDSQQRRDLLLWVPEWHRSTLWRPRNTAILSCLYHTKLDFKDAPIGEQCTKCFKLGSATECISESRGTALVAPTVSWHN